MMSAPGIEETSVNELAVEGLTHSRVSDMPLDSRRASVVTVNSISKESLKEVTTPDDSNPPNALDSAVDSSQESGLTVTDTLKESATVNHRLSGLTVIHNDTSGAVEPRLSGLTVNDATLESGSIVKDTLKNSGSPKTEDSDSPIYVEFEENDPRNPANMSRTRKWIITLAACGSTGVAAAAASTLASGFPSMIKDLNCTREQAATAFSVFSFGFGLAPLVTASFSEEFGRQPLYFISGIIFAMMHMMAALSGNVSTVIIARFIGGLAGSTGATMVGGTIADIWGAHERGLPMAFFTLIAIGSTALAAVVAGWVEQNPHLGWRWIQWLHAIISGAYVLVIITVLRETRTGVILKREAQRLRKQTGDNRYRARVEDETSSLRELVLVSCTRPLYILLTEPVAASFSLWLGFAWGVLYSQMESISIIFKTLHNFSDGQVGLAFVPMVLGAVLGFLSNFYQERLYAKNFQRIGPEARLYSALVAAVLFPVGCFLYAWTALPGIHWIGPMSGIFIFSFSLYIIYLSVFSYLADTYSIYASSALAGQSLCRNIMATVFPLFTNQMYARLTLPWASTLFGCVAVALALVPFVLFAYGPQIREKSRLARKLAARN